MVEEPGKLGDREGFPEWMNEVMAEVGDRQESAASAEAEAAERGRTTVATPATRPVQRRLLRWILR